MLGSRTHLVEIDLIRAYEPMLVYGNGHHSALPHPCQSQQPPASGRFVWIQCPRINPNLLPSTAQGDEEPLVDVGQLLHDLYDRAGYDLSVDYRRDPVPAFQGEDAAWVDTLLEPWRQGKA